MADDGSKNPGPFDVRTIKDLVGLMSRHDLSEIDLREGEMRVRLRRGPRGKGNNSLPLFAAPAPVTAPTPAPTPASTAPAAPAKPAKELHPIKSPVVGTFYSASDPNSEAFVRVGSRVTPSTVVCIIEAMKIFNEITADCAGVVTEICVDNQQPVEFDTVLFRVDPNG